MPSPVPVETRIAAVEAAERKEETLAEVARRFNVSRPSLARWLKKKRDGVDLTPKPMGGVRSPPALSPEQQELFAELVLNNPLLTMEQLQARVESEFGIRVSEPTLRRYLHARGIRCRRPERTPRKPKPKPPYRYTPEHRREGDRWSYPSCLTDAEWAVLKPLLSDVPAGRPHEHSRRSMLNAIFYVLRTGCQWRHLPKDFPPWQSVYSTFRRWRDRGLLERFCDRLREMWREAVGRKPLPTAAIIDSQSVKTTEKGGSVAMMERRRSRDENATS